jgi:phosphoglycolate phosphatase
MKYQNVIFDLDGTLLDTSVGILKSVDYTILQMGFQDLSQIKKQSFIGPPVKESFLREYGIDEEMANKATEIFRNRYKNHDLLEATVYPGIFPLFDMLWKNGAKIAVATLKREDYTIDILKHFKISEKCGVICGSDFQSKMTKKDVLEKCLSLIAKNIDKKYTVLIGDTEYDAIGAEEAGIDFIGVTYGFGFKTATDVQEYKYAGIAHSVEEVKLFLQASK